jgi:Ser/Thr protein kinase RdoA (MazF antagonist)
MADAATNHRELRLEGGTSNRGLVVKVDDTVRRPQPPGAEAVHAFLRHLERVGFDGAPRYLGVDDEGREVLTFVPGDVPISPYPSWALTDHAVASVGVLLRRFHEAARSFDPTGLAWSTSAPPRWREGLIGHNDPNLDNVVFRGGEAVALIDFDLAGPGSSLWDLAIAARLWTPLRDPRDVPDDLVDRTYERIEVLADAYGLARERRAELVAAARATHDWCYGVMRQGAERGQPGYVRVWTPNKRLYVERGRAWLATHAEPLATRLVDGGP